MLIQQFITWLRQHQDELFTASQYVWLIVSIALLIRLKVFRSEPLAKAPSRTSGLSVPLFLAVFLLYSGLAMMTEMAHAVSSHAAATATAPAASLPAASKPATLPSTTTAAAPATETLFTQRSDIIPDPSETLRQQLFGTFYELIPSLAIILVCTRLVYGGLDGWGFSLRKIPRGIGYGLLGFLIIYPILMFVANIVEMLIQYFQHRAEEVHETLRALSRPLPSWQEYLFILLAGVAAPVLEEIFFRGLIQTMLIQRKWGFFFDYTIAPHYRPTVAHRWAAIVVTSFIFAAIHFLPDHFAVLFLLSLALGYVYERTGNLWANITLHAVFNSFSIYFVLMSGQS